MKRILIADDDESIRWILNKTVTGMGFEADLAEDGDKALAMLAKNNYVAAFMDVRMPGVEGIEVLERVQARKSPARFYILTAVRRPDIAARASRAGAAEFLTKPFELSKIEELLRGLEQDSASKEQPYHPQDWEEHAFDRVVGKSRAIINLFTDIGKIADSNATILILGERGVGKELVARCVHDLGDSTGPFVAVNTGAIPKELQEAELFGYEKGAFTGAETRRDGKFDAARGGTIFLDEIGDMPPDLQAKLLRALQEREYTPVGSSRPRKFLGRVLAATNRDLARLAAEGKFRDDLFDR
ncbi:MAG: sigma-54 dependent transcriptional regulator, partial [Syntrophorhabdaceae bacterium]|nr:sigma-54 dependent transcriptional regulator [Syntrophorhabdaceae bacterium]